MRLPFFALIVLSAGVASAAEEPRAISLQKQFEGYRQKLPEAKTLNEMNGLTVKDNDGDYYILNHLASVSRRLKVKSQADCLVMFTYLKDPDLKMRFMAAYAIEDVVKAYPGGMSFSHIQKPDSKGHREMVRRFTEKILAMKR